jgi:hypothetical protein
MAKKKLAFWNPISLLMHLYLTGSFYRADHKVPSDVRQKRVNQNTVEYTAVDQIYLRTTTFPETREVEFFWKFLTPNKKSQHVTVLWSNKPIAKELDLLALYDQDINTLVPKDNLAERTVRHQFPQGGKIYLRFAADGDRWAEVILHEVQLETGVAVRGKTAMSMEQYVTGSLKHIINSMGNLQDALRQLNELEEKINNDSTLTTRDKQLLINEVKARREKLIRSSKSREFDT